LFAGANRVQAMAGAVKITPIGQRGTRGFQSISKNAAMKIFTVSMEANMNLLSTRRNVASAPKASIFSSPSGLWTEGLRTPPGQECSNGSLTFFAVVLWRTFFNGRRVFVFVVTLMFARRADGIDAELAYKQSAEAEAKAKERRELIEAEIARNQNLPAWAGKYFFGDGLELTSICGLHRKTVSFSNGTAVLAVRSQLREDQIRRERHPTRCELPNDPSPGFQGIDTSFCPSAGMNAISRGHHENDRICNAINSGLEPAILRGPVLPAGRGRKKINKAGPLLPENYARSILSRSITTRITHVQPANW